MRICKTCDTATEAFRKALLLGQTSEAMAAYSTGCVNLDRPYTIYHGEVSAERRHAHPPCYAAKPLPPCALACVLVVARATQKCLRDPGPGCSARQW